MTEDEKTTEIFIEAYLEDMKKRHGVMDLSSISSEDVHRMIVKNLITYIPDSSHKYRLTEYAWSFKGFEAERKEISDRKELETNQMQSVINTNSNVQKSNIAQIKFQNKYLLLTAFTAIFILISIVQKFGDKSEQQLQDIKTELQKIDTTLKNIQPFHVRIDSSKK